MVEDRRPPRPKRRANGWLLLLLGVVAGACALSGVPSGLRWVRLTLGGVGVVLLVLGALVARARMPGVKAISPDANGLAMTLDDGALVTVPWGDIDSVGLRRVKPLVGAEGWLLRLKYRGAARRPEQLRPFEGQADTGLGQLLIGLTGDQESLLRRRLPDVAGERFSIRE